MGIEFVSITMNPQAFSADGKPLSNEVFISFQQVLTNTSMPILLAPACVRLVLKSKIFKS